MKTAVYSLFVASLTKRYRLWLSVPDYQALMDAKAKKDAELAALLDDNENLMNTISTINVDNKERVR